MGAASFLHRPMRAVGKDVHRVGLSLNFGLPLPGVEAAFERGINYVFWQRSARRALPIMRRALARDREKMVIAAGPTLAYFGGSVRRGAEALLNELGTDYLDVLQIYWAGRMSVLSEAVLSELVKLREEGNARSIGLSIHDRPRAGELALASPFDVLMIRYNAAHPGAEKDIFPKLAKRQPSVVAYTATSWRRLLKAPRGWTEKPATAGDCYRFCLSSEHVDVVLMGPRSEAELTENLAALEKGPLSAEEDAWMRRFGSAVHG